MSTTERTILRRAAPWAAAVGLLVLSAACGGTPSVTSRTTAASSGSAPPATSGKAPGTTLASDTQTLLFEPFTSAGRAANIVVSFRTTGDCTTQSELDPSRSGAYHCTLDHPAPGGARSADPCFENTFNNQNGALLCFVSPVQFHAVQVTPDTPLQPVDPDSNDPWALHLPDGKLCLLVVGQDATVGGAKMTYRCPGGAVYGHPDGSASTWTASYAASGSSTLSTVTLPAVYS